MSQCPQCDEQTTKRMAIIEPTDLREERDYCLTCDRFLDEDARPATDE